MVAAADTPDPSLSSHSGPSAVTGSSRAQEASEACQCHPGPLVALGHSESTPHLPDPGYLPVPLAGGTEQRQDPSPVGPSHGSSTLQQQLTHFQLAPSCRSCQGCRKAEGKGPISGWQAPTGQWPSASPPPPLGNLYGFGSNPQQPNIMAMIPGEVMWAISGSWRAQDRNPWELRCRLWAGGGGGL